MIFRGVIFQKKDLKLLRFIFVLTIGKSFLNDSKRAQNSQKKLEKLLKFMTLTIGKLFLDDFKRAHFPPTQNLRNFSDLFFKISDRKLLISGPPGAPETPIHRGFLYIFCVVGHEF